MLEKRYRLRQSRDFQSVYRSRHSKANKALVLYYRKRNDCEKRFGFSLSKKVGKAHTRNRVKRQLREIVRSQMMIIKDGYDMVVIGRKGCDQLNYHELEKAFTDLMKKCGMYDEKMD